jgi:hypothetical protein
MSVPRYRIKAIDSDLRAALQARNEPTHWDIAAFSMASAWGKFITQRFGALKPNPDYYDITLIR